MSKTRWVYEYKHCLTIITFSYLCSEVSATRFHLIESQMFGLLGVVTKNFWLMILWGLQWFYVFIYEDFATSTYNMIHWWRDIDKFKDQLQELTLQQRQHAQIHDRTRISRSIGKYIQHQQGRWSYQKPGEHISCYSFTRAVHHKPNEIRAEQSNSTMGENPNSRLLSSTLQWRTCNDRANS